MQCKICGKQPLIHLWHVCCHAWLRCLSCGSDSSTATYDCVKHLYNSDYPTAHHGKSNDADLRKELTSNIEWFTVHRKGCKDRTFLDVGHCEGTALAMMQELNWSVHGFDINQVCNYGSHTTIAERFKADLFPRQYSAVLCREVIEHVQEPLDFLSQLYQVTMTGGLCQIQTPTPWLWPHPIPYQTAHLQLFSPMALLYLSTNLGFKLVDKMQWDCGMALLLRK